VSTKDKGCCLLESETRLLEVDICIEEALDMEEGERERERMVDVGVEEKELMDE
jgi:hypothetical protein